MRPFALLRDLLPERTVRPVEEIEIYDIEAMLTLCGIDHEHLAPTLGRLTHPIQLGFEKESFTREIIHESITNLALSAVL